jgi:hypothetical protein
MGRIFADNILKGRVAFVTGIAGGVARALTDCRR